MENLCINDYSLKFLSCTALTPSTLESITTMTRVRVQDASPSIPERRRPADKYSLSGIRLLSNAVALITAKNEGYLFQTASIS